MEIINEFCLFGESYAADLRYRLRAHKHTHMVFSEMCACVCEQLCNEAYFVCFSLCSVHLMCSVLYAWPRAFCHICFSITFI